MMALEDLSLVTLLVSHLYISIYEGYDLDFLFSHPQMKAASLFFIVKRRDFHMSYGLWPNLVFPGMVCVCACSEEC